MSRPHDNRVEVRKLWRKGVRGTRPVAPGYVARSLGLMARAGASGAAAPLAVRLVG